jgi:molybdopterin/thiamine biosynthesis adenylyltransferase
MDYVIRFTGEQHAQLKAHLFPHDGMEAVALALCGRLAGGERHVFAARKIVLIPNDQCERRPDSITWPTRYADALVQEAMKRGMAIVKVHSHPGDYDRFSEWDDRSDASFFRSVSDMLDDGQPHASVVMIPAGGGRMFARVVTEGGQFQPVHLVSVVGDDLHQWYSDSGAYGLPEFVRRHAQAFGSGTAERLRRMIIAVVGCSGTGSPLVEQLVRLGVGHLILIDPDRAEWKNLNRIYMSKARHANVRRLKVEMMAEEIGDIGVGTRVTILPVDLRTPEAVRAVAAADVAFGGMDSVAGRDLLGRLTTFYVMPYIDMGVRLHPLPEGGIDQITGAVHYLQPGRSSLKSRGVYTSEEITAELLKREDPAQYARRLAEKYIVGVPEDRPAVISVNTLVAAMAMNELLARIHPYRNEPNDRFAAQRIALHEGHTFRDSESSLPVCPVLSKEVGRGTVAPLLDLPELTERKGAA